jgi:hypothetical protein
MSMISDTGMALEVPVAFLSGVSSADITLAATGSDTAQKKQGVSDSRFTNACVAGVAMVNTAS